MQKNALTEIKTLQMFLGKQLKKLKWTPYVYRIKYRWVCFMHADFKSCA